MNWRNAMKLASEALRGVPDFARVFLDQLASGELDARFKWYGWEGAKEYAHAIARGDIASDTDIDERRAKCTSCPSRAAHPKHAKRLGSCGVMFDKLGMLRTPKTCGCPIEMLTCVASKACPQRLFSAVLTVDGRDLSKPEHTCAPRRE